MLTLRVTNTMAAEGLPREGGIGLRNVRDRLAIQFGERASFHAAPEEGQWVAEIRIPLLTDVLETTSAAAAAEPL
jgi:sensor histidine kinase YesM